MNGERQPRGQPRSAGKVLRFPINMPLSITGIVRRDATGYVLEMKDLNEFEQPITQVIPIAQGNTEIYASIEKHLDKPVTVEGRWLPDGDDACRAGCLQITSLQPHPSAGAGEH